MQEGMEIPKTVRTYRLGVRMLGGISLVFCAIGLIAEPLMLLGSLRWEKISGPTGSHLPIYVVTAISLGILTTLLVGSILLLRLRRRGLIVCAFAFVAEILYGLVLAVEWLHLIGETANPSTLTKSWRAAIAAGNVGMAPQFVVLYPLIGLGCILFLLSKSRRMQPKATPTTQSAVGWVVPDDDP